MPDVANSETRKRLSELVKDYGSFADTAGVDFYFGRVDVKGTGSVDPIGTPLVWNSVDSAFEVYLAQDIALVTTPSSLPNAAPICISVGPRKGKGFNVEDVTLSATAVEMTVLFRGVAAVIESGIDWGAADTTAKTAFNLELEKQQIVVAPEAETVDPKYVG